MKDESPLEETTKPSKPKNPKQGPIPPWAWLFVIGCGIIPVFTLGGAIPMALGFGGAAGCVGVARNPTMAVGARLGICAAILVGCWAVVIALVGAALFMMNK